MHLFYCPLSFSLLVPSFLYNSMCYLLKCVCDEQTNKLCKAFLDCVFDCLCLSAILFPLSLFLFNTGSNHNAGCFIPIFVLFMCVSVCVGVYINLNIYVYISIYIYIFILIICKQLCFIAMYIYIYIYIYLFIT